MSFLGLFPFTAPYLAWVLLAFSMVMGNPPTTDVVGICRWSFLLLVGVRLPEAGGDPGVPVEAAAGRSFGVHAAVVPSGELLCQMNLPELHAHQD